MKIFAKDGIPALLDELIEAGDSVFKGEVHICSEGIQFSGQLLEKNNHFLILKQPSSMKVSSGPNAGRQFSQFTYIRLDSIKAVTASVVEDSEK